MFWGTGNPAPWNPLNRLGDNTPPRAAWIRRLPNRVGVSALQRGLSVHGDPCAREVAYKGWVFPPGHRARLMKLTERIFLHSTSPSTPS